MKVGLFNPYLDTLGGGERYFLTVAQYFLSKNWQVDIFWTSEEIKSKIQDRFGIDLTAANFSNKPFNILATVGYDVIFFVSDGSLPFSFAKKNILHFQVPFTGIKSGFLNKLKLFNATIVCNSQFTKKYIDKTYQIYSQILYPPIDIENFTPGKKENIILGVGRFFAPLHPKKQEVMVDTFLKMKTNWELVLIGGITGEQSKDSVEQLKNITKGHKVKIITNSSIDMLRNYYSRAKLFWHAAGFGEDLENHPEKAEHFGMTTVEAMAAGCIPLAFAGGGQQEIIENGQSGYLWASTDELIAKTQSLMKSNKLCESMSEKAVVRARDFSKQKFYENLEKIV